MNLASMEPVVIFTLLNVAMALGLYITAMSGQLSMATAAIAGVGGYLAAVLTVKFGWPLLPATFLSAIAGGSGRHRAGAAHAQDARFHPEADDARIRRGAERARVQLGIHRWRQQLHRYRAQEPRSGLPQPPRLFRSTSPGASTARGWALRAAPCATIPSRRAPWACRSRSRAR